MCLPAMFKFPTGVSIPMFVDDRIYYFYKITKDLCHYHMTHSNRSVPEYLKCDPKAGQWGEEYLN